MPKTKAPPGLIDIDAAATMAGLSAQTLYVAIWSGELEATQRKKGAPWFLDPVKVRQWRKLPEPAPEAARQ